MSRIPLDLYCEIQGPDGDRYKWDANQPAGSRLRNFQFRTKVGEGFSDASGTLSRLIDRDYPDLGLVNTLTAVGADGSTAYEGRLSAQPRELAGEHSIGVTLTGWMAHAKDRSFTEIYVDRDLSGWGPASLSRKATVISSFNFTITDPDLTTDPTDGASGVGSHVDGAWASPYRPSNEAWYDAGPSNKIGRIGYSWKRRGTTIVPTDTNWTWAVYVSSDDKVTASDNSGNLRAAGPSAGQMFTAPTAYRHAFLLLSYGSTPAGTDGALFAIDWYKLAVYGNHSLALRTGEPGEPQGVTASDTIRDIATRFCPKLDTSGIVDTSYVVQHLSFKDRTLPHDAFMQLNKFHLWHLGVWENKVLHFRPYDLSRHQWEVRTDDPGTTESLEGPSIDSIFNGIVVTYQDVLTGKTNTVTPLESVDLKDTSDANPWNQHGVDRWDEITLSAPTTQVGAVQIARLKLLDNNRPKDKGTITVRGYIRDAAGVRQPAWKVRGGDTVAITNFPNSAPRLIQETSWDDETKTLVMGVETNIPVVDAYLDRLGVGLTARGLS